MANSFFHFPWSKILESFLTPFFFSYHHIKLVSKLYQASSFRWTKSSLLTTSSTVALVQAIILSCLDNSSLLTGLSVFTVVPVIYSLCSSHGAPFKMSVRLCYSFGQNFHLLQNKIYSSNRGFWAPLRSHPLCPLWPGGLHAAPHSLYSGCSGFLAIAKNARCVPISEPLNFVLSVPSCRILYPQTPAWLAPMLR